MATQHHIGEFQVHAHRVVVIDPVFTDYDDQLIARVRPGTWRSFVIRARTKAWGVRNASLIAAHVDMFDEVTNLQWHSARLQASVESGMLGIWDEHQFQEHVSSDGYAEFYEQCGRLTRMNEMDHAPKPSRDDIKAIANCDSGEAFIAAMNAFEERKRAAIVAAYDQFVSASVVAGGVIFQPGLGDGVYNVKVASYGDIVGIRIDCLSDADEVDSDSPS
jgi:hypothetical protein